LGLLIEQSSTNLTLYSEQFDNVAWVKTSATVVANATTAPDGASTADPLPGGLYDERNGSITLQTDLITWPQGETLAGAGSSLTYKYNTTEYFLNGSVPLTGNLVYLGIQ
jgi:hypothetical protein